MLKVNGLWRGVFTPVKEIGKFYAYNFLAMLLYFFWLTFRINQGSRELSRDLFSTGGKRKFANVDVFRAYLTEFSIFLYKIVIVIRSHRDE